MCSDNTSYGYFPNGLPQDFSYYQNELPWTSTAEEGQQYFNDNQSQVYSHNGFPEDFHTMDAVGLNSVHMYAQNQASQYTAGDGSAPIEAVNMSRWTSQASHMSGSAAGYVDVDQVHSVGLQPTLSQMSFPISSGHSDTKEFSSAVSEASMYAVSPDSGDYGLHSYAPLSPFEEDVVSINAFDTKQEDMAYPIFSSQEPATALYASMAEMPTSTMAETQIFTTLGEEPFTNYHWDAATSYVDSPISSPESVDDAWNSMPPLSAGSSFSKENSHSNARSPRYVPMDYLFWWISLTLPFVLELLGRWPVTTLAT